MKKKIALFLLALGLGLTGPAQPPSTTKQLDELSNRIEFLEGFQDNLQTDLNHKKKELEIQVSKVQSANNSQFWIVLGGIVGFVVVMLGGWPGIKASILNEAEKNAKGFVEDGLKTTVREFLAERTKLLEVIVEDYDKRLKIKASKKILVLSETQEEGEALARYLRSKGYQKVEVEVPTNSDLKNADLTILDWSDQSENKQHLTPEFISEYAKAFSVQENLLLFGPQDFSLDTKGTQLIFANYREKLDENIMQKLDAPGESSHFPT